MLRVLLVHPGDFVLPELGEELGRYAGRKLAERGLEIRPNTKVKAVTSREIELTDGSRIESFTLVWTAGTSPHPLLDQLDLPKEHNRLKVNAEMGIRGHPGVWALGDCAMIPDQQGGYQPPTAQHASREGKVMANNIAASVRGDALKPFRFKTADKILTESYKFCQDARLPPTHPEAIALNRRRNGAPSTLGSLHASTSFCSCLREARSCSSAVEPVRMTAFFKESSFACQETRRRIDGSSRPLSPRLRK